MHELQPLEPKAAAKRLRSALKDRKIDLTHGECLDLVAQLLGHRDWNVLAARLGGPEAATTGIETPHGWVLGGQHLLNYVGGLDTRERHLGQPVFWLRNATGENGHATLMQSIVAGNYRGKRVRFSGWLRTENVGGAATIFLRADDDKGRWVAFNSLEKQPGNNALHGTTGWSRREIVLDVPAEAQSLTYGMSLARSGEARFAGFSFETVGPDVPLTAALELDGPLNLDFSRI